MCCISLIIIYCKSLINIDICILRNKINFVWENKMFVVTSYGIHFFVPWLGDSFSSLLVFCIYWRSTPNLFVTQRIFEYGMSIKSGKQQGLLVQQSSSPTSSMVIKTISMSSLDNKGIRDTYRILQWEDSEAVKLRAINASRYDKIVSQL